MPRTFDLLVVGDANPDVILGPLTAPAGFIAARLRGHTVLQALETAAVCGALSTRCGGGTDVQPTWDEALTHVARNGELPS
ncbi:hypothetical protein ABZY19_38940 [Streptomyces sp. NPDC006475]|uniref:hypothetical protein n=1 Tax=Streptomyces sp. NPDC006475 TaxID=3155719 RepID=UPI0033A078B3